MNFDMLRGQHHNKAKEKSNWMSEMFGPKLTVVRPRLSVTIYIPHGYASAEEFLTDCGFEQVK